jgi:tRNA threonylcarbamoyladenosine biosynthesis protein TsaB
MILALDTALETCSACLYEEGRVIGALFEPMVKGHAERLIPMIDEVFKTVSKKPSDITLIAVTIGPGSFTGLRVALAAARSMGVALDIPVTGVSTLDALSYGHKGKVLSLIDARHHKSYAQMLDNGDVILPPALYDNEALRALYTENKCVLVGSSAKYLSHENHETQIKIEAVAALAMRNQPREASPFYLKEADVTPQIKGIIARA